MNIGGTLIAGAAAGALHGTMAVPGDKSMSHRSIMLAALADGVTEIHGFLPGEDNISTAELFVTMGASIEWLNDEKTSLRVRGVGLHGLNEPDCVLDAGNAGTCVRLVSGILAGQDFHSVLVGDASLHRRPMLRVVAPLRDMGATIDGREQGAYLPLAIRGQRLRGTTHAMNVASAQVKSCLLLAGLYADGETRVKEPRPTRDHTERMLPLFGQSVSQHDGYIVLQPTGSLSAPKQAIHIPADPSSAAFFAVAAALVDGSHVDFEAVGINPRRDGWRRILLAMQAKICTTPCADVGQEPVAQLQVAGARLQGVHVDATDVPDAIDEFPVLFVAAALAEGTFVLSGAEELRVKESDRIASMVAALQAAGADIEERPDGVIIRGRARLAGGVTVDAHGDHRIAMAMAVAAQCSDAPITIHHAAAIATSFPGFVAKAQGLGMNLRWQENA
ncbi:MAG: 3-phosphoshikimate 1-carboxyvinyltransferase [Mariprofundaceae bacterium]|nr:3-phosphoshikimate 1-carboxyvinyltransferase [Mariprofundaceae bacterium]